MLPTCKPYTEKTINRKLFSFLLTASTILTLVLPAYANSSNSLLLSNSPAVNREELISACKSFDFEWQKFLELNFLSAEQIEVVNVNTLLPSGSISQDNLSYKQRNICIESRNKFRSLIAVVKVTPESPIAKLFETFNNLNIPIESFVALKVLSKDRIIVFYNSSVQAREKILPPIVAKATLRVVSQQSGIPISQLYIVQSQYVSWSDDCLGLGSSEEVCTQALVSGWRVIVESIDWRWVYRTNKSGSLVRLESSASIIKPIIIPKSEVSLPLPQGTVFRATTTGGFAGLSFETILQDDGLVVQTNGSTAPPKTCQISPQQLEHFQQLINSSEFTRLNGLDYAAPVGAADFFTITFTSPTVTIRYSDAVLEGLPLSLGTVIQAWGQISNCT